MMNKNKKNKSKFLLEINNLNFKGSFVLVLLFVAGLLLKYSLTYMEIPVFWVDVTNILANAFITASILDILLSISNQRQIIKDFSEGIYGYIDMLWTKDYFPSRFSRPLEILKSENVAGDSGISNGILQERFQGYINSLTKYAEICTQQLVYIHDFDRKVTLRSSKRTGYIEVETVTDITYVNLRDTPYYAEHNPRFLRSEGSGESYRIVQVKVNGKDKTKEVQDQVKGAQLTPVYEESAFESGKKYGEEIPAHQTKRIWSKTIHEIPVGMFFQSKIFVLPCMNFTLTAKLDTECIERLPGRNPAFRWTLFETEATRPEDALKEQKTPAEGDYGILLLRGKFMKPGSGYALTLSFIYDSDSHDTLGRIRSSSSRMSIDTMLEEAKRWKDQADPRKTSGPKEELQKAFEKSKMLFEYILLVDPNNQEALKDYGGLSYRAGRLKEALAKWETLAGLKETAYHYWLCALAAADDGDLDEEEKFCLKGLGSPDDKKCWHEKLRKMLKDIDRLPDDYS